MNTGLLAFLWPTLFNNDFVTRYVATSLWVLNMHIETLKLTNFRCFGSDTATIPMAQDFTAFVGDNGSGKTAVMYALLRLFSISQEQRRLRAQDFHVPMSEDSPPGERSLSIEAVLALPELQEEEGDHSAVPEFFNQLAIDQDGHVKCRIRLEARWIADGSPEGSIEENLWAIRTFGTFAENDCIKIRPTERARIQMIYVPASRDGASQVSTFLRSRLWKAIAWSAKVKKTFESVGSSLQQDFNTEPAVSVLTEALDLRWKELNAAGTDTSPSFSPIDGRFDEFVKKVGVSFYPDESGKVRPLEDLSDGQRSIFHLAMTAATLDVEKNIVAGKRKGFRPDLIDIPALTLIAIEEPENSLAPFYLSRIISQIAGLTSTLRAQAFIASHSPSILARVEPDQIRHLRLVPQTRTAVVNSIRMPPNNEAAAKFLKQAVRAYPELYFARFVVLGEGASEEVILPRLAEALGLQIDRSSVAVVPLGGRHTNHLWRLLSDLGIPYATLLDLDVGRHGGAWGRIKDSLEQLVAIGVKGDQIFAQGQNMTEIQLRDEIQKLGKRNPQELNTKDGQDWLTLLRAFNIFFSSPLDIDYSMLKAFPKDYQTLEEGMEGPTDADARQSVLGDKGQPDLYPANDGLLRWYRYLFLGRGKPSTHMRVLGNIRPQDLKKNIPEELKAILELISSSIPQTGVGSQG